MDMQAETDHVKQWEDTITRLGAALVDRDCYSRDNVAAGAKAYLMLGDVDQAADAVAAAYRDGRGTIDREGRERFHLTKPPVAGAG